ncbi:sodium:proton antiporter NhaD [Cognatiluteimonas telluris]|uniref:sodium:proton antiporter NhaD n=1 Tax=Cognatiluteimonas telluris TaxID=1104775 RepID=UPI001408C509|nr:sodium:proton antiporter NhaD [Lysobacter telluris]
MHIAPRASAGILAAVLLATAPSAWAAAPAASVDLTGHWAGYTAIVVFVLAYIMVVLEEFTHLRKSQPVMLAAGAIWALLAAVTTRAGMPEAAHAAVGTYLLEYAELLLFLLAAMTYVNAMSERNVFEALRSWLLRHRLGYRALYWITGALAFVLSPVLDNLTTALVLCAVLMSVGAGNARFISLGCISIVVAANAGGAFSPFGDITTLMVWQKGLVTFTEFFDLFLPSLVNWVVPALLMYFAVPKGSPTSEDAGVGMKRGAIPIIALFVVTILLAVSFHSALGLPPFLGMMTGLALLKLYGWRLQASNRQLALAGFEDEGAPGEIDSFDSYEQVARAEWDTLLFFFGVIMCVGALGFCGYLAVASHHFYGVLGPTTANVLVGLMSAVLDNIPMMVAVLQMNPDMSHGQWLLVTLTAGVGGSLLSVGSAAGVALMGQARGQYTFFGHLKWTWAIALGYAASVLVHLWINAPLFAIGQ